METHATIDPRELARIIANAKKLAIQYRLLTGRPLGITGEVAEYAVPEHAAGVPGRIRPRGEVEIGVADPAGVQPDERLARFRLRELDVSNSERLPELFENRGLDPHGAILVGRRRRYERR